MIPVLNLLALGGGQKPISQDANTVFVNYQDDVLHVIRGVERTMTIYCDAGATKRISVDYSLWLPADTVISESTWNVENSSNRVTLANAGSDDTAAEVYVTAADGTRDQETWVRNKMVTDSSPSETIYRSILIKCLRTVS